MALVASEDVETTSPRCRKLDLLCFCNCFVCEFGYLHLYAERFVYSFILARTMTLPVARALPASAQAIYTQVGFVLESLMRQWTETEYIISPISGWLAIDPQVMAGGSQSRRIRS